MFTEITIMTDTTDKTDAIDSSGTVYSRLSREFSANGKSVQIDIYGDGAGGWLLEITDTRANSTCWQSPFKTDSEAYDEGMRALEEDGIDYFFGNPEPRPICQWYQSSKSIKKVFNLQLQK